MNRLLVSFLAASVCAGCGARTTLEQPRERERPPGATSFVWSKRFGASGQDKGLGVALDAQGDVFVTGVFTGTVDFGTGPLSADDGSAFVAKFDPDGHPLWAKAFGGHSAGRGIDVDAAGDVVIVGDGLAGMNLGGGPASFDGSFVVKLDSDGNHLWSRVFGKGNASDKPFDISHLGHAITVDDLGNVTTVGYFDGVADFGAGDVSSDLKPRIFVAQHGPGGDHRWSHAFRYGDSAERYAVANDAAGNVLVSGSFRSKVAFGGVALEKTGLSDVFVAKLDPAGDHVWSQRYGGQQWTRGLGVAATAAGDVVLAGTIGDTVSFGVTPITSAGSDDVFIARFDGAGQHVASESFGGEFDDQANAVVVDPANRIIATGNFETGVDFGSGPLETGGAYDVFVARFADTGAPLQSHGFGGGRDQIGWSLAADAAGSVVVTGWFDGAVDFGDGQLDTAGGEDIFVVKIPPP